MIGAGTGGHLEWRPQGLPGLLPGGLPRGPGRPRGVRPSATPSSPPRERGREGSAPLGNEWNGAAYRHHHADVSGTARRGGAAGVPLCALGNRDGVRTPQRRRWGSIGRWQQRRWERGRTDAAREKTFSPASLQLHALHFECSRTTFAFFVVVLKRLHWAETRHIAFSSFPPTSAGYQNGGTTLNHVEQCEAWETTIDVARPVCGILEQSEHFLLRLRLTTAPT